MDPLATNAFPDTLLGALPDELHTVISRYAASLLTIDDPISSVDVESALKSFGQVTILYPSEDSTEPHIWKQREYISNPAVSDSVLLSVTDINCETHEETSKRSFVKFGSSVAWWPKCKVHMDIGSMLSILTKRCFDVGFNYPTIIGAKLQKYALESIAAVKGIPIIGPKYADICGTSMQRVTKIREMMEAASLTSTAPDDAT